MTTFDINKNKWIFSKEKDIIDETELKKILFTIQYSITPDIIDNNPYSSKINRLSGDKSLEKGYWWISDDPAKDKDEIKTISGKIIRNNKNTDIDAQELNKIGKIYIETQNRKY